MTRDERNAYGRPPWRPAAAAMTASARIDFQGTVTMRDATVAGHLWRLAGRIGAAIRRGAAANRMGAR